VIADAVSRIEINQVSNSFLDFKAFAKAQHDDVELHSFQNDNIYSLSLKIMPSPVSATELICDDTSTRFPWPFVPINFRRTVFEHYHNLAYPGVAASIKLISPRYVWPNTQRNVKEWIQSCVAGERSKIHRHTKTRYFHLGSCYVRPHSRWFGPLPPSDGNCTVSPSSVDTPRWPEVDV